MTRDSRELLYDSSERELKGNRFAADPSPYSRDELMFLPGAHLAGFKLSGRDGESYTFVASVPGRQASGFWYRAFIFLSILTGGLLCYLLARHITSPVVHLRAAAGRFSGGDLKARIILPSVLERKDEIGALAGDFNRMASRIESLLEAQQRLIADVSHELRSPITRLSLALGLIRRQQEGDAPTSLARMEVEVERLNALISQLLTLSRLESLDQPAPTESIDLKALLQEVAADADFEAINMNRSVRLVECDPCSTRGTFDLLRSAIENVVRNAVKYTVPNGQVLIRLLRSDSAGTADLVIEDQGPGVPADALDHVFEPFYRVDAARDRRNGGAGLGLAITRQIVTLHGGSVSAMNRVAGGLEVRITLQVSRSS